MISLGSLYLDIIQNPLNIQYTTRHLHSFPNNKISLEFFSCSYNNLQFNSFFNTRTISADTTKSITFTFQEY